MNTVSEGAVSALPLYIRNPDLVGGGGQHMQVVISHLSWLRDLVRFE